MNSQLHTVADNMEQLLEAFPAHIRRSLSRMGRSLDDLVEIVADLGRHPEVRFQNEVKRLEDIVVSYADLDYVVEHIGFIGKDNRAGIGGTLHRISVIRNRSGRVVGLTARVGRAISGVVDIIRDIIAQGSSILLLGCPGVGKTTLLREAARVMADEFHRRVVIVDTSNEIAGDGDIPHPGIGSARRLQVAEPSLQHAVMIEAVENHMPQVVVIDEIGTEAETYAARTIAERGVALVATAHGSKLENLLMNPSLCDLVGGIESVTLSDEEAKRRKSRKAVLERKARPTFDVIVEIHDRTTFAVHKDVAAVVDASLRGVPAEPELRVREASGKVRIESPFCLPEYEKPLNAWDPLDEEPEDEADAYLDGEEDADEGVIYDDYPLAPPPPGSAVKEGARIFPFAISRNRLQRAIDNMGIPAVVARNWAEGDFVLTLRGQEKKRSSTFSRIRARRMPIHVIRANTSAQIQAFLEHYFGVPMAQRREEAIREAEKAVVNVQETGRPCNLSPQNEELRHQQHQLAADAGLASMAYGEGHKCYVRILPNRD